MRKILTPTACALLSLIAGVTMSGTLLMPGDALAAAHRGGGVSKVEDLPVREGDWSAEEVARGREQLVRAFDAAWIRVIASGKDREIVMTEPANKPGAAVGYVTKLVDCLPTPGQKRRRTQPGTSPASAGNIKRRYSTKSITTMVSTSKS